MKKLFIVTLLTFSTVLMCLPSRVHGQASIVYSESFISGGTPTTQCTNWVSYCGSLLSTYAYTGFKISGSADPVGIQCTNPTVAAGVANALRTGVTYSGTSDGYTWMVGTVCGSGCGGAGGPIMELTSTGSTCACNTGYTVRPAINNANWGCINGSTCSAGSQTMTVTFYYTPPFTASPTSLSFGGVTTSTYSSVMTSSVTVSGLTAGGSLTITPPSGFEVSLNGTTWFSSATTYSYSGTAVSALPIYVRFYPTTATFYSGTITVSGGGMATPGTIAVSGTGAAACSSAPTAGTAAISPSSGTATTPFSLSLTGTTITGGLTYQWQSSTSPSAGFTNISGATNPTYSFTGISTNMYYRAVVTCPSYTPSNSSPAGALYMLTLPFTGAVQTYTVPCGVNSLTVDVQGAKGGYGAYSYARGGYGGRTQATLAVTPGQVLYINVGGAGGNGSSSGGGSAGFNGGALGYTYGGGSGGASDIRIGGTALSNRVIVAGGGGGGGYDYSNTDWDKGGAGGDLIGEKGWGANSNTNSYGGLGGTQTAGGAGSTYTTPSGFAGVVGLGGAGGFYGGGGGGGYYGGGGGCYGGGGGGSSYADALLASSVTYTAGFNSGANGVVTLIGAGSGLITTAGSMAFGTVTTGTMSSVMTTTLSATAATSGGSLTITPPTGFQISLNSTTWSSTPLTYTYSGTSFSGVVIYVRFNPTSVATYTGTLDITGGVPFCGINLSGVGAPACTGTPTTGTAWIAPPVGSSTTTFSAGLLGGTVAGGLLYQWQSSSSPTSGFTNITGATNTTYSFTGISSNLYLQVVVTCPTFTPAISNTVAATIATPLGYTGTIGRYVVPAGVTSLNIITKGAQGGSTTGGYVAPGGLGAIMSGNFAVTPGQVLKYIVGQQPATATYTGGGGGGSFVWDSATSTPLIVSGGGGGAGYYGSLSISTGINAVTAINGTSGGGNDGGGGVGGYGGTAPTGTPYASGGAGWFSDGINTNYTGCSPYTSTGGTRPLAGGAGGVFGGSPGSNSAGGFGGGGGSQGYCSWLGGGGGGGYSGGAPGDGIAYPGGGGGSLNTGTSQANSVGNSGNGSVTITPLSDCVTPFSQATSFTYSSTLYTINASFANPVPAPMGYLVLMTTADVAPTAPDNGATYPLGDASLGGVVVSNSASTSFSLTGMTPETKRYFWVYAYNTMCANGPRYLTTSPLHDSASTQNCSLSGIRTVGTGGNYPTIAAALAEANVYGVHGTLVLELKTSYTGETYPIQLNSTYPCLSAANNIVIRPQGAMTITASYAGPLFNFDNARYITIDGRVGSTGTAQALTIINTNTSYPVISFVNDAMYDTVKYCIVKSPNISTATSSNQMGAICFGSTSKIYGNDYNTIDNCDITSNGSTLCTGIYSYGSSTKENSYNTVSNCNIYDYYYTSSTNFGIWLNSYNNNWTIKSNRFYQTASRSYVSGYNNGAIYISPGTTGMSSGFNISNNIIGYGTKTGTGTYTTTSSTSDYFRAIWTSVGVDEPTTIYGNTITALNISEANSSTTGGGAMTGIYHVGGSANIDSNVIGAGTGNGAITASMYYSGTVVGISTSATNPTLLTPAIVNIRKNVIGSITANNYSTTYGASVHAIQASQNASVVISNNIIGSTTTANSIQVSANTTSSSYSQYVYGINSQVTTTVVTPPVISNNIIANLYGPGNYSGNLVAGIVHASGSAGVTIKGNTVYNISGATTNTIYSTQLGITGITCVPGSSSANAIIDSNIVYNISNTNTGSYNTHTAGILFSAATDAVISRNNIYGIKNSSTYSSASNPPTATGVFVYSAGGSSTNVFTMVNNMITLGTAQTTNTSFTGIMAYSSSSSAHRFYHNTVLIEGTAAASAANHTAAFHRGGYNTTNTNTIDVRNNIFANNRTNTSGTAVHYAIANGINYSVSSTGWSSDYNLLNTANASNVGWFSGAARTFATWKTTALADFNSGSAGALTFTNSAIGDLHISMGTTANMVESHGTSLPSVNTDYDNQARPGGGGTANGGGFAPDLGADEFDGNPLDNIPPSITYMPLLAACGTGNRTFTATLADPAGIPTSGTLTPRVYYRKNSGTWYSSAGSLTSGTATNGVWTFTVVASDMGGLALGNTVQYFVVAQDNNAYVGSNTSGLQAGNVNSISTYPTTAALSYNVMPNLGGTYSVGSGGDYSTITAAVTAYNAACLSGPVTFNLISTTYPSETYPIQINGNSFASATNTLTIKPGAGISATVNGPASATSIFKLQDAKWVILDGVKTGGANLILNSTYTSTFANIWLASTNATISGCRNISLKNMDIVGGSNSTSGSYGILASYYNGTSSPTTSSGIDNDSITVQGNNISKCYYGIYLAGNAAVSAGAFDNWLIANNNIGPATSDPNTNIYLHAIYMSNVIGPRITGNTIQNIGVSTVSNQVRAINLSSNVNNAEISRNTIKNISANYGNDHSAPVCGIYLGSSVLNCSVLSNVITNVENTYSSGSGAANGIMVSTSQYVSNILIANNMISKILAKGWSSYNYYPSGIHLYSSTGGVKIYHNSINLYGNYPGYSGATGSANIMITTSYNNIDVRNNILLNTLDNTNSGTDKGYTIYSNQGSAGTFSYIDYNDYYVSSPNVLGYLSSDRTSLSAMQSGFGGNTHSINTLPSVVDTVNLRLQVVPTNVQFLVGTQLTQVPRDIDDTLRSVTNPVLGAHEVRIPQCNTVTLNAGTLTPATPVLCTEGMTNIITNGATAALNLTYQWLSSEDSTTWTTITDANSKNYAMTTPINGTTYYRLRLGCALDPTRKDSSTVKIVVNPSKILGTPVVCVGSVTTMSDTTVGGTWSSSSTGIATINATSGAMSGITAGTARITYTLTSSGCYTSRAVTVNPLPANILGSQSLCEGATTLLLNPTGTGTWVSSNLPIATVATSGLVSGLTAGVSNVSYVLSTGCLRSVAVSVNPVPVMSITPSSAATVCLGDMASFKATGHLPGFTLLNQNFNSGMGDWQTTKVSGAASSAWQVYPTGYSSVTGDGTPMLASTPEVDGGGNNILTSPSFSTVGYDSATLTFNQDIISVDMDDIEVSIEYSTNGGSSWTLLLDQMGVIENPGAWSVSSPEVVKALPTDALNKPDVKLRWKYNTTFGYYWAIDNIAVKAILPEPTYTWAAFGPATGLSCTSCDSVNVTPTLAGINLYSVTATTASGCLSTGGLTSVLVNTPPVAIGGIKTVCEGATTTLTNTSFGGSWSSGDVGKATVNSLTGIVTGVGAGTADVTYTMPTGCRSFTVVTVHATPAPLTGVKQVCTGFTTALSTLSTDGTWSSGASAIASVDATGVVSGSTSGVAPISYTNLNNCTITDNVTVNQYPAVITASTFHVCEGQSINLANALVGGTWTSSNIAVATVTAGSGIVTGVAAAGTVPANATISYTLPGGCARTQDITVDPTPLAISGTMEVCQTATTNLSSPTPGGTWSVASSFVASVDASSGDVTGVNAGTTQVTYTLGTGCKTSANVTVNQLPADITGDMRVCEGFTTTLYNAVGDGTWSSAQPATAGISALGVVNAVVAGTAEITYTLPAGCYKSAIVTVNPQPSAIAGTKDVCQGSTTSLSSLPAGGTWTSSIPGIAAVDPANGVVTGSSSNSGTATITYTLPEGCRVVTPATVNVLPAPITGTLAVCEGSTTTAINTVPGGTWLLSNAHATVSPSGLISGVTAGTANLVYMFSTGCSQAAVVTVNITPADITGNTVICQNEVTTLSSTTPDGVWALGSAYIATANVVTGEMTGMNAGGTSVTYLMATGCMTTTNLVVNQLPAPITGTMVVCEGSTVSVGSSAGGTWTAGNANIAIDAAGTVSGVTAGTTDVVYAYATGCSQSAIVTVNLIPAGITGSTEICETAVTTLASTTPGGSWSIGSSFIASIDAASGEVIGANAGGTPVVYTLPTGCNTATSLVVNQLPSPIAGTLKVCESFETTLSNTVGGGTWVCNDPLIAGIDASGVVTATSAGLANITYAMSTGCAQSAVVTVNALPSAITGTFEVCQGLATTLSSSPTGGTWTSNASSPAVVDPATGIVAASMVASGVAPVTYTLPEGCQATADVLVHVLPAPITGATSVCENATTNVMNTTGGGVWSTAAMGIASIGATSGTITGLGAGTAKITYALVTGCEATADVTVMAAPAPITGTKQVCQGLITPLTSITPGGTWNSDLSGIASVSGLGEVSGVTAGYVNINYILPTGCKQTALVTVNSLPAAYPVGGGGAYCAGGTGVNIGLLGSQNGIFYQLYNGTTPIGTTVAGTDLPIGFGLQTASGVYNVKAVNYATGCESPMFGSATIAITPVVIPAVTLAVPGGTSLCSGSSATYNAAPVNGGTLPAYSWEVNGSLVPGATSASYSYVPVNGDVVKVTLTSNAACAFPGSAADLVAMVVTTPVTPSATIVGPSSVCKGSPATMTVTPASGGASPSLQWYKNGSMVPAATGTSYTFVPSAGDFVYCAMATSIACNTAPSVNSNTLSLLTNPVFIPTVGITASPGISVAYGTPVTFSTIVTGAGAAPTYQWFVNGVLVSGATSTSYTNSTLHNNDSVTCRVTATEICGNATFNSAIVSVKGQPSATVNIKGNNSDIRLTPNPNTGVFNVTGHIAADDNETVYLEITNVLGQTVYAGSLIAKNGYVNGQVKLANDLASGMYLVSLKSSKDQHVLRFVLER